MDSAFEMRCYTAQTEASASQAVPEGTKQCGVQRRGFWSQSIFWEAAGRWQHLGMKREGGIAGWSISTKKGLS